MRKSTTKAAIGSKTAWTASSHFEERVSTMRWWENRLSWKINKWVQCSLPLFSRAESPRPSSSPTLSLSSFLAAGCPTSSAADFCCRGYHSMKVGKKWKWRSKSSRQIIRKQKLTMSFWTPLQKIKKTCFHTCPNLHVNQEGKPGVGLPLSLQLSKTGGKFWGFSVLRNCIVPNGRDESGTRCERTFGKDGIADASACNLKFLVLKIIRSQWILESSKPMSFHDS